MEHSRCPDGLYGPDQSSGYYHSERPGAEMYAGLYEAKKEGKDPVFRASDVGLKDKTDFWN